MLRNAIVFRESMEADRIVKVIGAFIAAIVLYSSFAAADETVTATDTDGSDDLDPPGFAALYAEVSATLRTSDCTYNSWSHTPGSTYVTPDPPYTWEWESYNAGDDTRDSGWTKTRLLKNGIWHIYEAFAVLPEQPTSEPPCLS